MDEQKLKERIDRLIKLDKLSSEYKQEFNLSEFIVSLHDEDNIVSISMNNGATKSNRDEILKDFDKRISTIMETTYIVGKFSPVYVGSGTDVIMGDKSTVTYCFYPQK